MRSFPDDHRLPHSLDANNTLFRLPQILFRESGLEFYWILCLHRNK